MRTVLTHNFLYLVHYTLFEKLQDNSVILYCLCTDRETYIKTLLHYSRHYSWTHTEENILDVSQVQQPLPTRSHYSLFSFSASWLLRILCGELYLNSLQCTTAWLFGTNWFLFIHKMKKFVFNLLFKKPWVLHPFSDGLMFHSSDVKVIMI